MMCLSHTGSENTAKSGVLATTVVETKALWKHKAKALS